MISVIWKEIRENWRWASLAFLAMAGLVAAVALPGSRAKDESHFSMFGS